MHKVLQLPHHVLRPIGGIPRRVDVLPHTTCAAAGAHQHNALATRTMARGLMNGDINAGGTARMRCCGDGR